MLSSCSTFSLSPPFSHSNSRSTKFKRSSFSHGGSQFLPLLRRCKSMDQFRQVHAAILKAGQDQNHLLLFQLLRLCGVTFESMGYAAQVFSSIRRPDVYHHTALIEGHISDDHHLAAIELYFRMAREEIVPDAFVISYCLKACALGAALREGRQVHSQVLKLSLGSERHIKMKLMELYGKCAQFSDARLVFGEMPERDAIAATVLIASYSDHGLIDEAQAAFDKVRDKDTVCWTAMIDGCVRNGRASAALELFSAMQKDGVRPNELTVVCALSACSQLGALELGRWIHSYIGKHNITLNSFVASALIDMYSKSGSLEEAYCIFDEMEKKDVVCYNSMIAALAIHGRSTEALNIFQDMVNQGLRPTELTFVGVLNACNHNGIVDKGMEIFDSMVKDYGLEPRIEHYGCMVDLLARTGCIEEAFDFVKGMTIEPDHVIWVSLLSACKIHGNLALTEKLAKIISTSAVVESGTYVLLANAYASFGKWESAAEIRAKMREKGIHKEPGCSSTEVGGKIHEFLLGDIRHPQREEIYKKLEDLNDVLELEGHVPAKNLVLQDIEDSEKKWALAIHSERLALCYALISSEPGTMIRIVKNLRVCNDCHAMIKIISKVTRRTIVVRDRKRFHHFKDGSCSCKDYW